jgi:serine/threonine-protein kinase
VPNDATTIGKYQLVNCMASGNSCQVWEAIDTETTRRVALKELLPEKLTDPEIVAALKHEFNVGRSFDHPNIVKYYEILVKKQFAYFVMDLFPAPSLKTQLFNDLHGVHMRLKRLIEMTASALEHIHDRGWVHRDIKPDNILMNKSSEVRVIDFSLSCKAAGALSKMLHRKQSTVQGTRTYMSPEQILGKPLTPQTDIYNFGVTLFELLTGEPPFKGSTPKDLLLRHLGEPCPAPSEFNPNVTPQMDMIVRKMLAKKPEQRHKQIAEFMAEFRNAPLFKEEVVEKVELTEKEKAEKELALGLGERLDSRADHMRTQFGVSGPAPKKKKKPPVITPAATKPGPGGQGARPPAPLPPPQMPMQPMLQMPGMPPAQMPGMFPGQMPMAPYPPMQMPQGPVPWLMQPGTAPGMPGPWVQAPGMLPPQPPVMPGAFPGALPGAIPPAVPRPVPVPVPPPAAVPVVPPVPPVRATQAPPAATQPAPAPAAPPKAKKAPVPPKPGEGFNIGDLAAFDELPPVN